MNQNIFLDQQDVRRENDQRMLETAFDDLLSIIDPRFDRRESEEGMRNAVGEILKYYHLPTPDIHDDDPRRQMDAMLHFHGVAKRRVELKGTWWHDAMGPMLGSLESGEIIALIPDSFGHYTYKTPDGTSTKIGKINAKQIQADAFCFYNPLPLKELKISDLFIYMLKCITIPDIIMLLGANLAVVLVGMLTPFATKIIYESVIPNGIKTDIFPVFALLAGALVGSFLFSVINQLITMRFENKISLSVENAAMMRIFSLPATFFSDYSAGDLASRVSSISSLCSMLQNVVLTTGLTGVFSLIYLFQMRQYAPMLVIPGLLIMLASLIFSLITISLQIKVSRNLNKKSLAQSGLTFGLLSGIQKIKLAGAEKRAFARWSASYKQIGKLQYSPPIILRISSAISMLISLGGMLIMYYLAASSRLSTANYLAFNTAYLQVSMAFMSFSAIVSTVSSIKPMLEMVQPILNERPEVGQKKKIVSILTGNIEINNMTFRYSPELPALFDGLSLRIRSGEYVAIVGQTGCGKSTLIRLLLGFEKPELGAIYYDGMDLNSIDISSARQCIGVDLQNGKLFSGDIFSNIVITAPWKTLEDAWEAAELAGIADDIRAMPMGMHTIVPDGGGGFSGGQRQRLLIARALVLKPKILFFDEATSALDNITQKKVSDNINALRCTRIVIAHRLSTIKHCDRIIVLNQGKIAEDGNYDELIERKGIFYELVKKQAL